MNATDLKGNSIAYIENLKRRIEWAYQIANEVIKKSRRETSDDMTARSDVQN